MNYVYFDADGRITGVISQPDGMALPHGNYLELPTIPSDPYSHYVKDNALTPLSDRPTLNHEFDYTTESWVMDQAVANSRTLVSVRAKRTELLFGSDWTQVPDAPLTDEQRAAWREYRQQLRDITDEYPDATDFNTVQWPTPPSV